MTSSQRERNAHTERDPSLADGVTGALLGALEHGGAAVCVCDERDIIRYVNRDFKAAFFTESDWVGYEFCDAVLKALASGRGSKLDKLTPLEFVSRVRKSRAALVGQRSFVADTADGRWLHVTDTRLPNGWIVAIAQDISNIKAEELQIRLERETEKREARTDALTGLSNRRHFDERIAEELDRLRSGGSLSLILLDIDHFKVFNDTYGHLAGDQCLKKVASTIRSAIRTANDDLAARYGGEEFAVILPRTVSAEARMIAQRISDSINGIAIPHSGSSTNSVVTASMGVATTIGDDKMSADQLINSADALLYKAKRSGRNRVEY